MKNKKRIQILLRILDKSDKIMDNVVQLSEQVEPSQPLRFRNFDRKSFSSPVSIEDIEDFRNSLIEQFKYSTIISQ